MGSRGPAKTPTSLAVLRGGKAPAGEVVPSPHPRKGDGSTPAAPAVLSGRALELWDTLAPDLAAKGLLTFWDVDLFARWCQAAALSERAFAEVEEAGIAQQGTRGWVKHPSFNAATEATALMLRIAVKFGLSPADRASLAPKTGAKRTQTDPADRILS